MTSGPSGTVTFLFTDIEGSTRLWEERPEEMRAALAEHDAAVRAVIEVRGGYVFSTGGDGFAAAFPRVADAVAAAADAQAALASLTSEPVLRVRMGVHTGEAQERDGDYFGPAVNRAARIMAAGHGGQVLVSEVTAGLVAAVDGARARGLVLHPLGEHRLADLSAPVGLWQLGERAHPPLRALGGIRHNLPIQATSLVGRELDVAEVSALLVDGRLVTLTGVGGVGKTRLALQVAAQFAAGAVGGGGIDSGAAGRGSDGVFLVELATVRDAGAVPAVVAATMGIEARSGADPLERICDVVNRRSVMVVLDNCEHLLEGASSAVAAMLTHCPVLRVVATSREPLGVPGEITLRVRSLPVGASGDGVAEELFVARARAADPSFHVDGPAGRTVSEICRRLDGIPLAIELAAARTRTMSVSDIAARLDRRFRLLTGGSRTALERHQTLRAAVDWSYSLLDDDQRAVLCRAAVFAGGFDLAAAEAVLGDDPIDPLDVLDHLVALTERSLLNADTTHGTTRYSMLETIRQFAREKLVERDEAELFADRHAAYYPQYMARHRLRSLDADLADLAAFQADVENLRAAFDHLADTAPAIDAARAAVVLSELWGWSGIGHDRNRLTRVFDVISGLDTTSQAQTLSALSFPAFMGGDLDSGLQAASRALSLDPKGETLDPLVYWAIGSSDVSTGGDRRALDHFDTGIAVATQRGDGYAALQLIGGCAIWTGQMGDTRRCERYCDALHDLSTSITGEVAKSLSKFMTAIIRTYTEPRATLEILDDPGFVAASPRVRWWSQVERARARFLIGDHERALEHWRTVAQLAIEGGQWDLAHLCLRWGGASLAALGDVEVAVELAAAADASRAWGWGGVAIHAAVERVEEASRSLPAEVVTAARAAGSKLTLGDALALFVERSRQHIPG